MSWSTRWVTAAMMAGSVMAQSQNGGSTSTTTEAQKAAADLESDAETLNKDFYRYLLILCGSLAGFFAIWRIIMQSTRYMRLLACLPNGTQRYFIRPNETYASFNKNLLYAPLFRKRHNREFQLSGAVNMGTLPTRLQTLFLIGYLGTNVAFCVVSIHWSQDFATVTTELRNRSGVLALVNLIPIFIMAARNNPLIKWLDISFDTFNLLHRWFGRMVVLEVLVHAGCWMADKWKTNGPAGILKAVRATPFILFGFITLVALVAIGIQSVSVIRHAFYETFKYLHISLSILAIITLWYHLMLAGVPYINFLVGVIAIWCAERSIRLFSIAWRNFGKGGSKALLEALPGGAVRVTVDLARPWTFRPGQHAYLYMPAIGLFASHPFSVAWSQESNRSDFEKEDLPTTHQDVLSIRQTSMSFVVRARTGFTASMLKKASAAADSRIFTTCFVEGPYGGNHPLDSYGSVMLVAGGIGITHQVPQVRHLVAGFANNTVAARRILLVWVIQSPEHLEWIRPWMTDILAMNRRRDVLRIMLFVSRPRSTKEIHSPSATVQMFPGRPNFDTLLDREMEEQVGAMAVSVCGSGAMSDDVRAAVRKRVMRGNVEFVEEAFSW